MRVHVSKQLVAAFAVVTIGLAAAGVGFALWASDGTGFGQSRALTTQAVTVTAATGAADLYPGFAGGDVFFTITNPNPYAMTFGSMTAGAVTSSNEVACPAANVTVADVTSGLTLSAPAASTSATQSIGNVVTMAAAAPNGCQGVTFTIALTLVGTQA